jgi:hypothetical protein
MKPVAFTLLAALLVSSCGEAPPPATRKPAGTLATGTVELREVAGAPARAATIRPR